MVAWQDTARLIQMLFLCFCDCFQVCTVYMLVWSKLPFSVFKFHVCTGSDTCFYGKCLYCKNQANGVCANKTKLEGAVIFRLPKHLQFQQYRHPWARTYKEGRSARWLL